MRRWNELVIWLKKLLLVTQIAKLQQCSIYKNQAKQYTQLPKILNISKLMTLKEQRWLITIDKDNVTLKLQTVILKSKCSSKSKGKINQYYPKVKFQKK